MHLLNEKEYQDYSAYKKIEPQIKGCLDRERELKKQLKEKEEAIKYLKGIKRYDIGEMLNENIKLKQSQNKTAIEELEKIKEFINNNLVEFVKNYHIIVSEFVIEHIDYIIKKLQGENNG